MKTELELMLLSKSMANDFIRHNKDLTTSLLKISKEHSLSQQEVKRVAEQANVETYMLMIGPSKDKYVEFAVADPERVFESTLVKTAELNDSFSVEYEAPNKKEVDFSFALLSDEYKDMDKDLAVFTKEAELNEEKEYLKALQLDTEVKELILDTEDAYSNLAYIVKQAMAAKEYTFDEVQSYIKTANLEHSDDIIDLLKLDLVNYFPLVDFTKVASISHDPIETESEIYQALLKVDDNIKLLNKYAAATELEAGTKAVSRFGKWKAAGLIAGGALAVGSLGAAYVAGAKTARRGNGYGEDVRSSAINAMSNAHNMR